MIVEIAEEIDRQALFLPRSEIWSKFLTPQQYAERNLRLYAHPFAKNHITTWLARDPSGSLLSSCDILEIEVLGLKKTAAILVASVYTPSGQRGHDYARSLLESILLKHPSSLSILFSDLRPSYYEKMGYRGWPVREVIESVSPSLPLNRSKTGQKNVSIDPKLFIAELNRSRSSSIKSGVTIQYEELYLDWHMERYRYFAELSGFHLPTDIFWIGDHGGPPHPMLIVPQYLTGTEEGLLLNSECCECLDFLRSLASSHRLPKIRYWNSDRVNPTHYPMIRGVDNLEWKFQQPIDEW